MGAEGSFGGDWDAGLNAFDNPPGLYPRDDLALVTFYTSTIDLVDYFFNYMRVRSVKVGAQAADLVTFDVDSWMSQGIFTLPTGSA